MVVLHYTAMESAPGAIRHLCNPQAQVSAHYVISARGEVTQLVPEEMRAWHAGAASWGGEVDVNSRSIGIELSNTGFQPFPEPQMAALERQLSDICARWQIAGKSIVGHSDVAPGRKIDPGARFDWRRLARRGLAVWPECLPEPASAPRFRALLGVAGYTADVADEVMLGGFRLRFRPHAKGVLDAMDMGLAAGLARDFPVDPARRRA